MVGPLLMFGAGSWRTSRVFLDLLVGRSNDPLIQNLVMGRVGFHYGFSDRVPVYGGLSIGTLFLALDENAGLARDEGDFNLLLSLVAGVKF